MKKEGIGTVGRGLIACAFLGGGMAAGTAIASAETNPPQIHEQQAELQPIQEKTITVKTVTMESGKIYPLPASSIVISNDRNLVVNNRLIVASQNRNRILLTLEKRNALVTAPNGGKAQIDINPRHFEKVVEDDINGIHRQGLNVEVREHRGPMSFLRRSLIIGGSIAGALALLVGWSQIMNPSLKEGEGGF